MCNHFYIAKQFLKIHEGLRNDEYIDTTGHRTVGYGWNLSAKMPPDGFYQIKNNKTYVTNQEAEQLLDISMATHWAELVSALPWVVQLDEWRKAVVLDMAFNMGIPTLKTFKNTLAHMRSGEYVLAANGMMASKWKSQVKRRADVLIDVMRFGYLSDERMAIYKIDGGLVNA